MYVMYSLRSHQFCNISFLLIGDFNANNFDTHSCQLVNLLSSFNLFQVVQEPTRIAPSGNATLIDLVLVSNKGAVNNCSTVPPLVNSDHNGISLTINKGTKISRKQIPRRSIQVFKADFARASDMIGDFDWDSLLYYGKSIDEACNAWKRTLLSIKGSCQRKRMCHGPRTPLDE